MADSLISINVDLQKIDSEIRDLEAQVAKIESEINFKKQLKQYALSQKSTTTFDNTASTIINTTDKPTSLSISDFIIDFITKNQGAAARNVIEAYAEAKGVEVEEIRNNVYNTLSRLKSTHKLRITVEDGLSRYYINNESSHEAA